MPSEESHWIAQPSILMQAADALLRSTVPTATRSGAGASSIKAAAGDVLAVERR